MGLGIVMNYITRITWESPRYSKKRLLLYFRHRGLVDGLLYQQSRIALSKRAPGWQFRSATGHMLHHPAVRKTVKLSRHLAQGLCMRGHLPLREKESIFSWSFQHCSVAMAFRGLRKINLNSDTSSCSSSNITNALFHVLFFFSLTCTFVELDCPQLVQGKYSMGFFFFLSSIFF